MKLEYRPNIQFTIGRHYLPVMKSTCMNTNLSAKYTDNHNPFKCYYCVSLQKYITILNSCFLKQQMWKLFIMYQKRD